MNSKKAKLLRKLVRLNVEKNAQLKNVAEHAYVEIEKRRKYVTLEVDGKPDRVQVAPGQLMVAQGTLRGMNKALKKNFQAGKIVFEPTTKRVEVKRDEDGKEPDKAD